MAAPERDRVAPLPRGPGPSGREPCLARPVRMDPRPARVPPTRRAPGRRLRRLRLGARPRAARRGGVPVRPRPRRRAVGADERRGAPERRAQPEPLPRAVCRDRHRRCADIRGPGRHVSRIHVLPVLRRGLRGCDGEALRVGRPTPARASAGLQLPGGTALPRNLRTRAADRRGSPDVAAEGPPHAQDDPYLPRPALRRRRRGRARPAVPAAAPRRRAVARAVRPGLRAREAGAARRKGLAMKVYYDRRAAEYDDWWLGTGLFADRDRPGWAEEVEALIVMLEALPPARTLDVACGTGFLTRHLPGEVVGLDQSARMLAVAGSRLPDAELVRRDALALPFAGDSFDRVFTSHFYCHLDAADRERFLHEARRVATQLVVVASVPGAGDPVERYEERILNDGSRWTVLKRVFTGEQLAAELGNGEVLHEGRWFVVVRA